MSLSISILLFLSQTCFAAVGPFGSSVSSKTLNGIDQKGCEAGKILEQEQFKSGIDLTSGSANYVWKCNDVTSANASEKRCPYPQDTDGAIYKCFSNTATGGTVMCISGSRSEEIKVKYGDSNLTKENQPRFSDLKIFSYNSSGNREDRSFKMDSNGCQVSEVLEYDNVGDMNNGTVNLTFDECSKMFSNAMNGGPLYPGQNAGNFCQDKSNRPKDYTSSYWTRIKKLNHCFTAFPNFLSRYENAIKENSSPKKKFKINDQSGVK